MNALWAAIRGIVIGLAIIGAARVVYGQPTAEMTQAIVRIHNGDSAGSGCLIGKDERTGLIVTCNHLFTEGVFQPVVAFPNGERFAASVVAQNTTEDLAALVITTPSASPVPLANYRPDKGTQLFSAGYGDTVRNTLAINAGQVTHYADRGHGKYATVKITGSVRNGDSGGPIFNEQGELAAVIWGGSSEGVYGTGSHEVNVLLAQCQNGVCQPYRIQQPQMRPAQPIARPAQPPLAPIPSKPCNCDNGALIARITKLEAELVRIQGLAVPGQPGPTGQKGEKGDKGEPGQTGKDATVNIDELVSKLPPIKFEIWDDGKLQDSRNVPLGGVVPLERFVIGAEKPQ